LHEPVQPSDRERTGGLIERAMIDAGDYPHTRRLLRGALSGLKVY
jgi:hypothetical protein